jgi:hypothetical protein
MPGHNIRVLETLRLELKLVELGLYRVCTPGRPFSVFEDSPICPRHGAGSCSNCALMMFVPYACRAEPVPCHYIRLNEAHETIDSLYRTGTQEEQEEAVRNWLTATIKRLGQEEVQTGDGTCDTSLQNSSLANTARRSPSCSSRGDEKEERHEDA